MDASAAEQHEIERLQLEIARLRELERSLLAERERVRADYAAEIGRLQEALRAASTEARDARGAPPQQAATELADRARQLADRERGVAEREVGIRDATVDLADRERETVRMQQELAGLKARLLAERQRLEAERRRLVEESDRLAEWERAVRSAASPAVRPVTFREGLARLGDAGADGHAPAEGSW